MSEFADLLHIRADESAKASIDRLIEHGGMDCDDPGVQAIMQDTLYGAFVELERTLKHLGIDVLDALPIIGSWALRQFASRP